MTRRSLKEAALILPTADCGLEVSRPRAQMARWLPLLGVVAVWPYLAGKASDPPPVPPLTAAQQAQLKERDRIEAKVKRLDTEAKFPEAIAAIRKMLAIERAVHGDVHDEVYGSHLWLARLHAALDDPEAAGKEAQEALRIARQLHPENDWRVIEARLVVAYAKELAGRTPEQRRRLVELCRLVRQVDALTGQGKYHEAEEPARQAVTISRELLGEAHAWYGFSLFRQARLYDNLGQAVRAKRLYRQVLEIERQALGEEHPDYASVLSWLGILYYKQGSYAKAESLFRQALKIHREARGAEHAYATSSLGNLTSAIEGRAERYLRQDDFPAARQARQEVLDLRTKRYGPEHWQVTDARLALADVELLAKLDSAQRGRLEEAKQLLEKAKALTPILPTEGQAREAVTAAEQAVAIRKQLLGEGHRDYAASLEQLGICYYRLRDYTRAEPLYCQALAIRKKVLGEDHPNYHFNLVWLAMAYRDREDYQRAEPLYRQALAIRKKLHGANSEIYASTLAHLGEVYQKMRDYSRAEPLLQQALEIREHVLGDNHPDYADALRQLGSLYKARYDYARAEPMLLRALEIQKEARGEEHLGYEHCLNALAELYAAKADYARAEPLYIRYAELVKKLQGETHPNYATSLNNLAEVYGAKADYAKAEALHRRVLEIEEKLVGKAHPAYATSLNNLAAVYSARGDYGRAEPLYRQAMEIRKKALGEAHPDYAASLNNLAMMYDHMGDYARAEPLLVQAVEVDKKALREDQPGFATSLGNLGSFYQQKGDYARAEPLIQQALEIRKKKLGENHPDYALSLNNLAGLYQEKGDYARAEPLFRRALEIEKQALGETHPSYATTLNNLASQLDYQGDYTQADALGQHCLEIRRKALGETHPDYAMALNNQAVLYRNRGDYVRAEPLLRQAVQIFKKALGEDHTKYATALNNLAVVYEDMGDYARAEPLELRALEVRKKVLGETHRDYAVSLTNLASLYSQTEELARAEPLLRQAADIWKKALGEGHPTYATALNNLGALARKQGDFARAETLFQQAAAIRKKALGEAHPTYGHSLASLGGLYRFTGGYAQGEALLGQGLDIEKKALGETHPECADTLSSLGLLYDAWGRHAEAETMLGQALKISRATLELTAAVQSERQQLAMAQALRERLDAYVALTLRAKLPAEQTYGQVLAWKGTVFARQRLARDRQRVLRESKGPELVKLYADLENVTRRLGALALRVPSPQQQQAWKTEVAKLGDEKERLETELFQRSAAFRARQVRQQQTPAELRKVLPPGTALIDFLEYTDSRPPPTGKGNWPKERRLAAFVVRPDRAIAQLDLGPVDPIATLVDRWRTTLKRRHAVQGRDDPAVELRRLVWQPLAAHLDRVRTVLVSPDGVLARLPLPALPGKKSDTYLIEELGFVVLPVPQLLPEMLGATGGGLGREAAIGVAEPTLLLVGDVDFGATPGAAGAGAGHSAARSSRTGLRKAYDPLKGTRAEILAVRDSFEGRYADGRVKALRRAQATEAAVREQAPRHRWLHFATHGFFAEEELRSALGPAPRRAAAGDAPSGADPESLGRQGIGGFHPGLLSGIVLAGANLATEPGQDDGILTALEVAELNLGGVELAVLSACETGLGEVAGGEGVLGLQRAFQVAGAKTVAASLWAVDDEATRALMTQFYENLWGRELSKLEALREAQLWLLREGPKRGLVRLEEEQGGGSGAAPRAPPYYWAAFVLSGDWR